MSRIARPREESIHKHLPNFILTRLSNIRYRCGFSERASTLRTTPEIVRSLSNFRDQEQTSKQVFDTELIICRDDLLQELRRRPVRLKEKIDLKPPLHAGIQRWRH
jgi:hypothetical protein